MSSPVNAFTTESGRFATTQTMPTGRPGWLRIGVPSFIGQVGFIVMLMVMARLVGGGFGVGEPVWTLPQQGWQPWAVIMLGALTPLLLTSLCAMWLSVGDRRARMRQVALALLWPIGSVTLGVVREEPLAIFDVPVWWHATPMQAWMIGYGIVLAMGLVAWCVAWLTLTVAEWQPPAHLVRRPIPQR